MRTATIQRHTNETQIEVTVNLDGSGRYDIKTGIGFLDHMLDQLARHSLCDLTVRCDGDLHIDDHHSTEDVGIAIGMAVKQALGDKRGISRYGACLLPMDETLSRVVIDFSGRPFLVWRAEFPTEKKRSAASIPNWSANGSRALPVPVAQPCMLKPCTAQTATISPSPYLKA
jgi:imidazoleglycerol-phosphate dehydratase